MATTAELKRWAEEGARIVTLDGRPVIHHPAKSGDRTPWIDLYTGDRYPAAELKAVTQDGGPWSVGRLVQLDH